MTTSGVALLAELEGMAQRATPKVAAAPKPVQIVSAFLSEDEVKTAFIKDKRPNTYANLRRVCHNQGLEVFFKKKA